MNNIKLLLFTLLTAGSSAIWAQGAKNIKLNEVLTNNTQSIVDECGERTAWIELANTSFSSYNVRGMYITTNRKVLNPALSAPERIRMMSIIPNGDTRTQIGPRQHLLLYANSNPSAGKLHLTTPIQASEPVWIALYNGNGVELIDSVTVPVLAENQSYARQHKGWTIKASENVTPGIENFIETSESKIEKFKREDPHGVAMAIMAMSIVFSCLALLWIFFSIFGAIMKHLETAKVIIHKQPIKPITKTVEKTIEIGHKTSVALQEGFDRKGIDMEVYMAVIGMAIRQYEDDVHDVESGIITIKPKDTGWDDEYSQMTHLHNPFLPLDHKAPNIPTTPELY